MAHHPNEVGGRGSEGGHEKVNKTDSAMSQALSGKVMSEIHKPGDPSAWPRMSDLTTGKDHIQYKPEAAATGKGTSPQPMKLEGQMLPTDTRPGNLMSASGKQAFETVHGSMVNGQGMEANRQASTTPKETPQHNVHQVADTSDHAQKNRKAS